MKGLERDLSVEVGEEIVRPEVARIQPPYRLDPHVIRAIQDTARSGKAVTIYFSHYETNAKTVAGVYRAAFSRRPVKEGGSVPGRFHIVGMEFRTKKLSHNAIAGWLQKEEK